MVVINKNKDVEKINKRSRHHLPKGVLCLAVLVVFITTYMLILPAITMETDDEAVNTYEYELEGYNEVELNAQAEVISDVTTGVKYTFKLDSDGLYNMTVTSELTDTVTIADNLMASEEMAPYKDSVKKVVFDIDADRLVIGERAFENCISLAETDFTNCNVKYTDINAYAFYDCISMSSITTNTAIGYIGECAFANCTSLCEVNFANSAYDEDNLIELYTNTFQNCTNLKELDLTPLKNLDVIHSEVFYGCTYLKTIKVPGNVSTLKERAFGTSSSTGALNSLTSLIFEDNYKLTKWPYNAVRCSGVKDLDLRPFKAMTDIGGNFTFTNSKVVNVWFPKSLVTFGGSVFRDITHVKNAYFEEGSEITSIGGYAFYDTTGITELDLSILKKLTTIADRAFSGSAIREVTLPEALTTLGAAFVQYGDTPGVCLYLKDILYNAKALESCSLEAFGSVTDATFTIGDAVDTIPAKFIASINGHAKKLAFIGENEFSIAGDGTATGLEAPLDTLGGDYYVTADGDLYKIDKAGNTATLIYKERAEGVTFELPKMVGLEKNYTVTGIGPYAFKSSGVSAINFEDDSALVSVDERAFLNSKKLDAINGKTSVKDVVSYFEGLGMTFSVVDFAGTALDDLVTISAGGLVIDGSLNETGIFEMLPIAAEDGEEHKYEFKVTSSNKSFLTGQEETITVYASGSEGSTNVLRLYFESEDECTRLKDVQQIAGCPVKYVENVDDTKVSYYEIGPWTNTGSTGILQFNFCYPNLISGTDNHLMMWAVAGSQESFNAIGEKLILPWDGDSTDDDGAPELLTTYPDLQIGTNYLDILWDTKAYSHPVEKSLSDTPSVLSGSDKTPVVGGVAYKINLLDNTDTDDGRVEEDIYAGLLNNTNSYGSDFVEAVDFEDILQLPEGLEWRDGLTEAIKNGDYYCSVSNSVATVMVTVDGEDYLLCTINRTLTSNVYYVISMIDVAVNEAGQVVVKWSCDKSSSDIEIQDCAVELVYGDDVIVFDEEAYKAAHDGEESVAPTLENVVKSTEYYNYAEPMSTSFVSSDSFVVSGVGILKIDKVTVNTEDRYENSYFRFGEDITSKVTVSNPTPYTYSDLSYISENLKNYIYIKPENIMKMFKEDDLNEDSKLTIQISSANLLKSYSEILNMTDIPVSPLLDSVVSVDGETSAEIYSPQYIGGSDDYSKKYTENYKSSNEQILMTDDFQTMNASITIIKNGDNFELTITHNNVKKTFTIPYTSDALENALNYLGYVVTSETVYGINYDYLNELTGGEVEEHYIYTTYKNSLMKTGVDVYQNFSYPNNEEYRYQNGSPVVAYDSNRKSILSSTFPMEKISPDLKVTKYPQLDNVQDESTIDYKVNVRHYGTGTYDALPIVDYLSGIQAMLVPISGNKDSQWAKTGAFETYNEEYYILMPPEGTDSYTFEGVMVGNYYADSVTVTVSRDSQGYVNNIETITKWYMVEPAASDFSIDFRYKALIDLARLGYNKDNVKFSINNTAYVGDRESHRIYDYCSTEGSALQIDKNIVTEESSGGLEYDVLAKHNNISQGNRTITYRLEIINPDDADTITVSGNTFHDQLPLNTVGGNFSFEWVQDENISIRYVITDGVSVSYNGETVSADDSTSDHWYLSHIDPKTLAADNARQQFLCWNRDFRVSIAPQKTFYIYVTLQFPGETDEQWSEYVAANSSPTLYNTFYISGSMKTVSHDLVDSGKAFLQKGVYELGYYRKGVASSDTRLSNYSALNDRITYRNTVPVIPENSSNYVDVGKSTVAYYVVLANTGNTKLYLSTVYDQLPEGFKFYSLRNNTLLSTGMDTNGQRGTGVGTGDAIIQQSEIYEGSRSFPYPLAVVGSDVKWNVSNYNGYRNGEPILITLTSTEMVDGHQQLAFDFSGGILESQTDEVGSYLEPGQWISFGYECIIGYDYETEDVAENTVAMKYIDPNDVGVFVDNTTSVEVSKRVNKSEPNDGTRELWSNSEAVQYGFSSDSTEDSQWLTSQVSVYRGSEAVPGIAKTVKNNNTQNQVEHSNVNLQDIAYWTVKYSNEGDVPITNYTIEDTLEAPHHFVGTVNLTAYTNNRLGDTITSNVIGNAGAEGKVGELFTIDERDYTSDEKYITVSVMNGYYNNIQIPTDGTETKILTKYGIGSRRTNHNIYVSFTIDKENETETLKIRFEDSAFAIASDGYNLLEYQSQNLTMVYDSVPVLYNSATLYPHDTETTYNYSLAKGSTVTDAGGQVVGVQDMASISTDVAFPTTSSKSINMKVGEDAEGEAIYTTAVGDGVVNSIATDDVTREFTYNLVVNNAKNRVMNKLVIIDNLPQHGDGNTLTSTVPRESEFKVVLSSNPNFKVSMTTYTYDENGEVISQSTRDMESDEYKIEYSTIKSSDFSTADWQGLADDSSQWTIWDSTNTPTAEVIKSIRSIRLVIDDGTKVEGNSVTKGDDTRSIPEGATIELSFNAVIDETATEDDAALEGETAWNTFAYEYLIIDGNGIPNHLFATPQKVGISVPTTPTLSKSLINRSGEAVKAAKDEIFKFIIYSGQPLAISDYSTDSIGKLLADNERKFTYVELKVPEGKSVSDELDLSSLVEYQYLSDTGLTATDVSWQWDYSYDDTGTVVHGEYNIVELNSNITYIFTNASGAASSQNYAVKYDPFSNLQMKYVNYRKDFEIVLLKTDGGSEKLANAVFALYSPNAKDLVSDEKLESLLATYGLESADGTIVENEISYYLCDISASGIDGKINWKNLYEDNYIIKELKPPDGYEIKVGEGQRRVIYPYDANQKIVYLTVVNKPGVVLPATGGSGTQVYMIAGLMMVISSMCLLLIKRKRPKYDDS